MPEWEHWPDAETVIRTKCFACDEEFTFKWGDVTVEGYKGRDRTKEYAVTCPKCEKMNRYLLTDLLQ